MFILFLFVNAFCLGAESQSSFIEKTINGSTIFLKRNFNDMAMEIAICEQLKSRKKQYFYACDAVGTKNSLRLLGADAKQHFERLNSLIIKKTIMRHKKIITKK